MSFLATGVTLAAYVGCIGLALAHAHRLCSRATNRILALHVSTGVRSALASIAAVVPFALAFSMTIVFASFIGQDPIATLGLAWDSDSLALACSGLAIAICCVMLMFICGLLMGFIRVTRTAGIEKDPDGMAGFWGGTTDYFAGAVLEEIVARGFIYHLLNMMLGWTAAIVGSATIFALVHLIRPSRIPFLFTVNALIFGLLTGVCRFYTGSLWLPIGLHLAWNVTAGPILGLPYSGSAYEKGFLKCEVSGPEWLTGGFYSPDAGMLGTCALALAAIGLRILAPIL